VIGEGTIEILDGVFEDDFGGCGFHLYRAR
jgi:hypothetical protein